jgi:uncharacterized membrane protein
MTMFANIILTVHIAAGFLALVVGPIAMATRKGGNRHRQAGRSYFWAMVVVIVTALFLAIYDLNVFLLAIAVFSFYATASGYRALYLKRLHKGEGNLFWDRLLALTTTIAAVAMFVLSVIYQSVLTSFFGVLILLRVASDLNRLRGRVRKDDWFFDHISAMLGAYIATVTAFLSTSVTFLPTYVVWMTPTIIGSVGISLTIRHYKKRLQHKDANDIVETRINAIDA